MLHLYVSIIGVVIALAAIVFISFARPSAVRKSIAATLALIFLYFFCNIWQDLAASVNGWLVSVKLTYIISVIIIYWLGFTLIELCGDRPPMWLAVCATVITMVYIGIIMTIDSNGLFYMSVQMVENPAKAGYYLFETVNGPLYTLCDLLIVLLNVMLIGTLYIRLSRVRGYKATFMRLILALGLVSPVVLLLAMSGIVPRMYTIALEVIVFVPAICYLQVKYDLVMSASVAKDISIDNLSEGLLIFNLNGHLIYHNNRAEQILTECEWNQPDREKTSAYLKEHVLGRKVITIDEVMYEIRESEFRQSGIFIGTIVWIVNTAEQAQLLLQDEREHRTEVILQETVMTLANAIDAKDKYTNGHSTRVAKYAMMLAERMGKSKEYVDNLYFQAVLHDVGKIGIPDDILNKPGKLTDEEFDVIKTHCMKGFKILSGINSSPDLAVVSRWHHERYDGTGYPDGLKGGQIPEAARIVAIADAYDAMSSERGYRHFLSQEKVESEIRRGMGTQFDPEIAAVWLEIMAEDVGYEYRQRE